MLSITFDFATEGLEHADALLDPLELRLLFDQTQQTLRRDLERQLAGLVCAEHGRPPALVISGRYNHETEQLDLSYHIDTCCPFFLARVVATLNRKV